jgi:hypothetical protein
MAEFTPAAAKLKAKIERVFTRDVLVDLPDGSWISTAVPPEDGAGWQLFDINSHDRKSGWQRISIGGAA